MNRDIFTILGMTIYLVLSIINRFFMEIPDGIYIPFALVGIALMIVGIALGNIQAKAIKKEKDKEKGKEK